MRSRGMSLLKETIASILPPDNEAAWAADAGIPDDVIPIAYLCVGYVREFPDRPILASKDWAQRLPPKSLIHFDSWNDANDRTSPSAESLLEKIDDHSIWLSIFPEDSRDKPPSRD